MRLIVTTLALGLLAAGPGLAKERMSDSAYIQAARCQGVLGEAADASLKTLLKEQSRGRQDYVQTRALDAKQAGRRAGRQDTADIGSCARYAKTDGQGSGARQTAQR